MKKMSIAAIAATLCLCFSTAKAQQISIIEVNSLNEIENYKNVDSTLVFEIVEISQQQLDSIDRAEKGLLPQKTPLVAIDGWEKAFERKPIQQNAFNITAGTKPKAIAPKKKAQK